MWLWFVCCVVVCVLRCDVACVLFGIVVCACMVYCVVVCVLCGVVCLLGCSAFFAIGVWCEGTARPREEAEETAIIGSCPRSSS